MELRRLFALHVEKIGAIMSDPRSSDLQIRTLGVARSVWAWLCNNSLAWSCALLAIALAIFAAFQASVIPGMSFWVDELFSFYAGDPRISFSEAFATRILPDTNGPIYFSLIYLVQGAGLEGRTAFVVLNYTVIAALFALVIERGWRTGMLATAISAVAIMLVSGPLLTYAPEGRVYGMAMGLCALLAFYCAGAVASVKAGRMEFFLLGAFAVLGAWMHVFAAIFACSLATDLVVTGWLVLRRRDLVVLGFMIGRATMLDVIVWLAFAFPLFTGSTSWMTFTPRDVFDAQCSDRASPSVFSAPLR